jgi:hypothetical protein
LNPEKVAEIEKIQNQLRPKAFNFTSEVQKEFEIWLSKHGPQELTPEIEAEWQEKIEAEKQEKLLQVTGGKLKTEAKTIDGSDKIGGQISNMLIDVKGLGQLSVDKLRAEGVGTIEEFRRLPYEEKVRILGPVVATKFEDFN